MTLSLRAFMSHIRALRAIPLKGVNNTYSEAIPQASQERGPK